MREIKFRAKRVMNGNWVFGSLLSISDTRYINGYSENGKLMQQVEVIPETVGQFTGRKNIYESDIMEWTNGVSDYKHHGTVIYNERAMTYDVEMKNGHRIRLQGILNWGGKVIGNIHEK